MWLVRGRKPSVPFHFFFFFPVLFLNLLQGGETVSLSTAIETREGKFVDKL